MILDEAAAQIISGKVDTVPVRLALRVLLPHVACRGDLTSMWQAGSAGSPQARSAGFLATFASVREQLQMMGRL
ncbi:MAG: hypothetical protein ACRYHC_04585 [Janthinobacterium lividum]